MKKIYPVLSIILLSLSAASPALAQSMDNDAAAARMERIEKDLMLLQRQLSRGGSAAEGSTGVSAPAGSADIEVRLSSIEEQMREILGRTEENDFQVKKLAQNLEKLQKDTDFRFNELNQAKVQQPAGAASTAAATTAPATAATTQRKVPDGNIKPEAAQEGAVKSASAESETASGDSETNFTTPRDHYNYAFRLLNQTQYDKAAESFADFIKKHPKDPLVGNAYYWQGETFYIRRDYVKAADSFRQGFEELPAGPKAPDNLLKLAMTLNALKRGKEACVVLTQVVAKFKTSSAAVAQKAEQEQKSIGCK